MKSGLVTSRSEARRAVQQGGVAVDGNKVTDIAASYDKDALAGEGVILKKGKKNFRRIVVNKKKYISSPAQGLLRNICCGMQMSSCAAERQWGRMPCRMLL